MIEQEQIQHEAIKTLLKQAVQSNPDLTPVQKQIACENIDRAALQADWIVEIARACGWLK